jgi:hypothetical protein
MLLQRKEANFEIKWHKRTTEGREKMVYTSIKRSIESTWPRYSTSIVYIMYVIS